MDALTALAETVWRKTVHHGRYPGQESVLMYHQQNVCDGHILLSPSIYPDSKYLGDHWMDIQYHNYTALNVRVGAGLLQLWRRNFASTRSPPVLCIKDVWNINYWDKLCVLFSPKMLMLYKHIRESCTTATWGGCGSFYQQLCWPTTTCWCLCVGWWWGNWS